VFALLREQSRPASRARKNRCEHEALIDSVHSVASGRFPRDGIVPVCLIERRSTIAGSAATMRPRR
jgi:hypothetical protein